MNSLEELAFALDVVEVGREPAVVVAAPADYVPGANPNQLSDAELEQRRQAAAKSADARRKNGVGEALRIRNEAVANAAVRKAQTDFFIEVAGINRKSEIRDHLKDPSLTQAQKDAYNAELADVYATENLYNSEKAKTKVQRQQKLRYWQQEMADAGKRYDSAAWANAKANADALKAEMDDEEVAGALLKEHQNTRKKALADQERVRKAAEAAEKERQRNLKKFFAEAERQQKKRAREAESAAKKAKREAEKKAKEAEKKAKEGKGGGKGEMSAYQKAVLAEAEKERTAWYGGNVPEHQTEAFKNRNAKPKKPKKK